MLELDLSNFPDLSSERITLRRFSEEDANDVHRLRSDQEIMQYIGRPLSRDADDSLALIQKIHAEQATNSAISWAIINHENCQLVGSIGLYRLKKEHFRGEVGYLLDRRFWGQGLMTEALNLVLRYSFESAGFHSLEADVNPANENSVRLLLKNGFKLEGKFRDYFFYDGNFYDTHVFSILASDFKCPSR